MVTRREQLYNISIKQCNCGLKPLVNSGMLFLSLKAVGCYLLN